MRDAALLSYQMFTISDIGPHYDMEWKTTYVNSIDKCTILIVKECWRISSFVFITNGPYRSIGSFNSGLSQKSRIRRLLGILLQFLLLQKEEPVHRLEFPVLPLFQMRLGSS